MNIESWQKAKEIFQATILLPRNQQRAYLLSACDDVPELQNFVSEMIEAHYNSADFLEDPQSDFNDIIEDISPVEDQFIGKRVGAYRIEKVIGEGGMGIVYLGLRDDDAFQREVAIKFIKRGMDSVAVLRRFRQERNTLAALNHPNIARLHDAGSNEDGLPYFVMEYIEGLPIIEYCDKHQLTIPQRLRLFRKVCDAISYAHQNLVIHRDLKPGNILVSTDGEPKLLDFGISKLLQSAQADITSEFTIAESRFVTPQYASPEQIQGLPMTTTSDIYSLGLLLYRLLSGQRAYSFKNFSRDEIERVICKEMPSSPSSSIMLSMKDNSRESSEAIETAEEISTARQTSPSRLRRELSGDLDKIILMALRKESQRRYATVDQFSEDIHRYLSGRPVTARRDTFTYLAGKFIRRHRGLFTAGVLSLLILISGIFTIAWQANIAARERDKALMAQQKAERINDFFQQILSSANPRWFVNRKVKGPDVTVLEVLNEASAQLDNEMDELPSVKADLHMTMGITYQALGKNDECIHHFEQAYKLRSELYAEDDPSFIESLYYLAIAQGSKADYDAAIASLEKAIRMLRLPKNKGNVYMPHALNALSSLFLIHKNDPDAAEPIVREASEYFKKVYGPDHLSNIGITIKMSDIAIGKGELDSALKIVQQAEESLKGVSDISDYDRDEVTHGILNRKSKISYRQGLFEQAELQIRESIYVWKKWRKADGLVHHSLATAYFDLGQILNAKEESDSAAKYLNLAKLTYETYDDSSYAAAINIELGKSAYNLKRIKEAEHHFLKGYEALAAYKSLQFKEFEIQALEYLVRIYNDTGKATEAAFYQRKLP